MKQNRWVKKLRYRLPVITSDVVKTIVILLFMFPFYWMIVTSFKTYVETVQSPPTLWPQTWTLEAYRTVINGMSLGTNIKNTVIITVCIIVMQIAIMIPAAYVFAKYRFRGGSLLFGLVMVAQMVPVQITFISVYIMMSKAGLLNSLIPQIIPFGANAFGIFLMRQNFMQIPDEIIEAARLDNANELQIMFQIMLPMAKSSMITVALFSFISHWNSYFWPLVMTTENTYRPISIAIASLKDVENGLNWATLMAGNVLMMLPLIILFLFASQKIIATFAYRGVK